MESRPIVRIAFLDVGQGDTIVISLPETKEAVIVDCIDADAVLSYLERENIQHIRGLLITHLHLDHYSSVVQFLENVERELSLVCKRVFFHIPKLSNHLRDQILYDDDGHSDKDLDDKISTRKRRDSVRGLLRWAKSHRESYNNLTKQPGINLPLDGVIELIHPWEVDIPDLLSVGLNNTSGIIKVNGPDSSALLTGDIEPLGWEKVDSLGLQCDVLKFPHHGAWKGAHVRSLLDVVNPSVIVISVGTTGTRYDHPNKHVFEALARLPHIRLLCTQVTSQCAELHEKLQSKVISSFNEQAKNSGSFFVEQKGCPCAGTVIVELGNSVSVLQPDIAFHQNEIIKTHYDNHQCKL